LTKIKNEDFHKLKTNIINSLISQPPEKNFESAYKDFKSICSNGSWNDIDYEQAPPSGGEWEAANHINRLKHMSIAYNKEGQVLYHSKKLKKAIEKALSYIDKGIFKTDKNIGVKEPDSQVGTHILSK
jgi:hypothetical protein